MSREDELAAECEIVREQVGVLAEQVGRLMDVISRQGERGRDTGPAEDKMAVLESLMWKLHRRHMRLKSDMGFGRMGRLLH
jgi:hypothetical protein